MALLDTAPQAPTQQVSADRRPWLALGLAALSATSYAVVLVVPWWAAGAPDPAALSYESDPHAVYPSVLDPLLTALFFWALGVAPFASIGVAGWSAHRLWATRGTGGRRLVVWSGLLVAAGTFAWFVLQGAKLLIWTID